MMWTLSTKRFELKYRVLKTLADSTNPLYLRELISYGCLPDNMSTRVVLNKAKTDNLVVSKGVWGQFLYSISPSGRLWIHDFEKQEAQKKINTILRCAHYGL